jgi:hypothetical protein
MMARIIVAGLAPGSIVVASVLLGEPVADADPASDPQVAYCRDMASLGHRADCVTLAGYGRGVCAQFDKGTDWYAILQQLDTITLNQQFSADLLVAAVRDICPWNASKKP